MNVVYREKSYLSCLEWAKNQRNLPLEIRPAFQSNNAVKNAVWGNVKDNTQI